MNYKQVRKMAAEKIESDASFYAGFLDFESDEKQGIREYCEKIRSTTFWGGHVELDALSKALDKTIIVYQADAEPLHFGKSMPDRPLRLCYQKFAYSLGEHYDSLLPSSLTTETHYCGIAIEEGQ